MPVVEPAPKPPGTPTGSANPLFTIGPYQWNPSRLLADTTYTLYDDNGSDGYSHRSSNSSNSSLNGHDATAAPVQGSVHHQLNETSSQNSHQKPTQKPALPPRPVNLYSSTPTSSATSTMNAIPATTPSGLPPLRSQPRTQRQESFSSVSSTTSGLTEKEYSERIAKLQLDSLIPLKEDVADWLNRILVLGPVEGEEQDEEDEDDDDAIRVENFMDRLENGVIVCRLAKLIERECRLVPPTPDKSTTATTTSSIQTNCNFYRWSTPQRQKNAPIPTQAGTPLFTAASMKCWDKARAGTFFARDNVSNFLNWCRMLGVNDAVLFETEDLVSHVNQRNVVLCLLEVARIACTKHHFSPAPGLVEFEQEIDREIEAEERRQRERTARKERKQQEREAKARRDAEMAAAAVAAETARAETEISASSARQALTQIFEDEAVKTQDPITPESDMNDRLPEVDQFFASADEQSDDEDDEEDADDEEVTVRSHSPEQNDDTDSGRPQSSSDQEASATESEVAESPVSQIPIPRRRSPSPANSVMSCASSACTETALSSVSGSSLTPTPVTSELDHKVMQIAKSYYGKEARQGVQRLSEGKYKIANRIVFVRLLKARHVMVRVGGGWTTLSHFLARHGGDPNQQVLPEELMPMDTKVAATSARKGIASIQSANSTAQKSTKATPRSNSTHTLVIPFHAQTPVSSDSLTSGRSSRTTSSAIQSTPVSRRSSVVSSPEPLNSCSSGYSTGSGSFTRPFTAKCMTDSKIPKFRSRLPSLQLTPQCRPQSTSKTTSATPLLLYRSRSSFGFATPTNLTRSSSSTVLSHCYDVSSSIPKPNLSRYPNYLKSSQHITPQRAAPITMVSCTTTFGVLKPAGSVSNIPVLTTPTARQMRASTHKLNQL